MVTVDEHATTLDIDEAIWHAHLAGQRDVVDWLLDYRLALT